MINECLFCTLNKNRVIIEGKLALVINDNFPVTPFHSLIIPKRHFSSYFDMSREELLEINELINKRKEQILYADKTVSGFNIGINIGKTAGQSIFHLHIHLIPRREGDISDPRGGIRAVIPDKKIRLLPRIII